MVLEKDFRGKCTFLTDALVAFNSNYILTSHSDAGAKQIYCLKSIPEIKMYKNDIASKLSASCKELKLNFIDLTGKVSNPTGYQGIFGVTHPDIPIQVMRIFLAINTDGEEGAITYIITGKY